MTTIEVIAGDSGSVDKALKELDKYFAELKDKANKLQQELAEYGASIASLGFARAIMPEGEYSDISINVRPYGKGVRLQAMGMAVFFIEFGTGTKYGYGHPDVREFGPKTWSLGPNGEGHLKNKDFWYTPDGRRTEGNPPAMAMYKTRNEMVAIVTEIARKVFK